MTSRHLLFLLLLPLLGASVPAASAAVPSAAEPTALAADSLPTELQEAVALYQTRQLDEAEKRLRVYHKQNPQSAPAVHYLGRVAVARGELKRGVELLEEATQLDPSSSEYFLQLGDALVMRIDEVPFFLKLGIARRLLAAFATAVELDPDNLEARAAVASYHAEAPALAGGDPTVAAAQLEEIRRRDPARAHFAEAAIHERLGRLAEAEQALRRAITSAPETARYRRELGLFYERQNRPEDALEVYRQLLVAVPGDSVALYRGGRLAMTLGQKQLRQAREALEAYLAQKPTPSPDPDAPDPADAHWRLGTLYARQGETDKARREFEAALEIDPGHDEARKALVELSGGS